MMTRKHFNTIAETLAESKPIWVGKAQSRIQWEADCNAMADVFQSFNPRFNKETFIKACNQ
jgi:hypothetical protein